MCKRVYPTCYSLTVLFNLVRAYIVSEYSFRIILQLNENHTRFGSSINARGLVFSTFNYHFWPLRSQPMVLIYNSYIEGLNYLFVTVSSIFFMCVCHMISPCRTLSFTALSKYFPSLLLGYYGIRTSKLEGHLSPLLLSILAISHNLHSILKGLHN